MQWGPSALFLCQNNYRLISVGEELKEFTLCAVESRPSVVSTAPLVEGHTAPDHQQEEDEDGDGKGECRGRRPASAAMGMVVATARVALACSSRARAMIPKHYNAPQGQQKSRDGLAEFQEWVARASRGGGSYQQLQQLCSVHFCLL